MGSEIGNGVGSNVGKFNEVEGLRRKKKFRRLFPISEESKWGAECYFVSKIETIPYDDRIIILSTTCFLFSFFQNTIDFKWENSTKITRAYFNDNRKLYSISFRIKDWDLRKVTIFFLYDLIKYFK